MYTLKNVCIQPLNLLDRYIHGITVLQIGGAPIQGLSIKGYNKSKKILKHMTLGTGKIHFYLNI